ncbi:AMIN-like domain-containing (lipo)protein [Geodermatophilus nigrescens]
MTRRALLPVCAVLSASLLLTACGEATSPAASTSAASSSAAGGDGGEGGGVPEESSAPRTDEEVATDSPAPSFPADTSPDTAQASPDALVTVTDVRTGRHDGFDRVVLEVDGAGTPGWDVRWVDAASSQGSGAPVVVAGEAVLQVTVTGAGYPYDTGVEEYAGGPVAGQGTGNVTEVVFDATYEGTTVAFVGARAEAPFRVYLLQDPVRVVVEVADAA